MVSIVEVKRERKTSMPLRRIQKTIHLHSIGVSPIARQSTLRACLEERGGSVEDEEDGRQGDMQTALQCRITWLLDLDTLTLGTSAGSLESNKCSHSHCSALRLAVGSTIQRFIPPKKMTESHFN